MTTPPEGSLGVFAYRSQAASGLTRETIATLVGESWKFNLSNRMTGLLMFEDGRFQQVLEGRVSALSTLVAAILADPRHECIEVTRYGLAEERLCENWTVSGFDGILSGPSATGAHQQRVGEIVRSGVFEAPAGPRVSF